MVSGHRTGWPVAVLAMVLTVWLAGCGSSHPSASSTASASPTSTVTSHKHVRMPIVVGYSVHLAVQAIRASGLRPEKPQSRPNRRAPQGTVTGTNPPGNNVVLASTAVILYVSSGPAVCAECVTQTRVMRNVCGLDFQQANTILVQEGITLNQRPIRQASSKRPGTVIGSVPAAGTSFIASGSSAARDVTLVISSGHTGSSTARSRASC